ncbi:hypothetical protein COCVIDRAFT_93772, partial [Bipolaris victoriae FI3]
PSPLSSATPPTTTTTTATTLSPSPQNNSTTTAAASAQLPLSRYEPRPSPMTAPLARNHSTVGVAQVAAQPQSLQHDPRCGHGARQP